MSREMVRMERVYVMKNAFSPSYIVYFRKENQGFDNCQSRPYKIFLHKYL